MSTSLSCKLVAVQAKALTPKAKKHTDKLNAVLIDTCRASAVISYLASPVTGGGVPVNRFQKLFMLFLGQGKKPPQRVGKVHVAGISGTGTESCKGMQDAGNTRRKLG